MQTIDETVKHNEELWDSRARTYDTHFRLTRWTQKKLVSLLKLGENPYLLDLACGTGWALRYAACAAKGRGQFYGVDNSSQMIEQAKDSSTGFANVHFCKSKVEQLSFDDDFFDFVISSNAFHHFSNPEMAVREAFRVLKPKARMYILDTTADNFFMRLIDKLNHRLEPAHLKLYSTKEYQAFFEKARLHYVNSKPVLAAIKIHIAEKIE
jgi:ubiquinone/menaquinone biosynthesis C-methylase UbiE